MASNTICQATKLINNTKLSINISLSPEYAFEFPFERSFDAHSAKVWMAKHWTDSFYLSLIYVFIIFTGKVSFLKHFLSFV